MHQFLFLLCRLFLLMLLFRPNSSYASNDDDDDGDNISRAWSRFASFVFSLIRHSLNLNSTNAPTIDSYSLGPKHDFDHDDYDGNGDNACESRFVWSGQSGHCTALSTAQRALVQITAFNFKLGPKARNFPTKSNERCSQTGSYLSGPWTSEGHAGAFLQQMKRNVITPSALQLLLFVVVDK